MNYIKEINAFYDWLEINELSASAVNLWFALMHINNKAGWAGTFTVAESVLSVKTQLTGRTVRSARNELKQRGRIDFKSRTGGRAPIYTMISFEINNSTEINSVVNVRDYVRGRAEDTVKGHATLNKLNKTKQNNEKEDNVFQFYEKNGFGTLSPFIREEIEYWYDNSSFEETDSIILLAMKLAVENNVKSWSYVNRILENWSKFNLKTLNDIDAYLKQYRSNKFSYKKDIRNSKKEKIPDYILNQEKKYHQDTLNDENKSDHETKESINRLLKELGEA